MIWAPVELAGMMGTETGLTETIKGVDNKVLLTAGYTVSCRRPRLQ